MTTLVADLETPVSAYLKLARGRAGNMFLLESVEGGAQRGRYSMIGLDPDLVFRSTGERAEINRTRAQRPGRLRPLSPAIRSTALRALLDESRIDAAAGPAADVGRRVRLSRLRHGAPDGAARRRPSPTRSACPDMLLIRPTVMVVFDAARDEMAIVTPIRPAPGVSARAAHESGAGAARRGGRGARGAARPRRRRGGRPARRGGRSGLQHDRGRIQGDGRAGRRTTSPPATPSRSCCRSASRAASTCRPSRSTGR